jgi:hypothetical protein
VSAAENAAQALARALTQDRGLDLPDLAPADERDPWAMADDALTLLVRLVRLLSPSAIVEFGSGASTVVLAAAAAEQDPVPRVVALENDPLFERHTSALLERRGLRDRVDLRRVPLVARSWYGQQMPVYLLDDALARDVRGAELVLVDGPPQPLGGRAGSLLQALHLGRAGTVVLLDDADRPGETAALAHVHRSLGERVRQVDTEGFSKGLAALVLQEPLGPPPMPPVPELAPEGS